MALRSELENIRNEENKLLVNKAAVVESQALEIVRLDSLLKQTVEELRATRDNARNKNEHDGVFVAELSILKRQVNEKNKKIEEMKDDLKARAAEIEGLKKRSVLESRRLEASAAEVTTQTASLSYENQKLKDQLTKSKKAQEDIENKLFELQADYMLQASQFRTLKERLESEKSQTSLTVQLEETQSKNAELRLKIIEIEKERLVLKERVEKTDFTSSEWEKKLLEKDRALSTNLQIIDELEKRIEHYEKKDRSGDNPARQVEQLRALLAHKGDDMKVLEDQNQRLKAQNEALQEKLDQLKQKVTLIHDEVRLSKQQTSITPGYDTGKMDWFTKKTEALEMNMDKKIDLNIADLQFNHEENLGNSGAKFGFTEANLTSSFNRAMENLRGEELQAGRSVIDTESQASILGEQKEVKASGTIIRDETIRMPSQSVSGKLKGLEELVKVLERENLLLVRKFEASRRETSELNDRNDDLARKLREGKLKIEELITQIESLRLRADERDRSIAVLNEEKAALNREKEILLERLRQEEEMGPGVSRDLEWNDALQRLKVEVKAKDREISLLKNEIIELNHVLGKLREENQVISELESDVISLKAKLHNADEQLIVAEREAATARDQMKRLAKEQVRSENEQLVYNEQARKEAELKAVGLIN